MIERVAEGPAQPRARIAGTVYLLYFMLAAGARFLLSRGLVTYGTAANLVAIACYAALIVFL